MSIFDIRWRDEIEMREKQKEAEQEKKENVQKGRKHDERRCQNGKE